MDRPIRVERAIPTDPSVRSSESLFLTESAYQGAGAARRLLGVETIETPDPIAHLVETDQVIVRRRLMSVNGVPVRISNSYFPAGSPESETLKSDDFIEGGLQQLFERHGRRFGHARETLTARLPNRSEAELLQIDDNVPVVHIVRASFDAEGDMVHILESICAADKHVFVVTQMPGDNVF
jgi:GntR family transcriptional regulator